MHVAFVTPSFFGYETAIAEAFAAAGARVTLVDERPGNSSWVKAAARVAPSVLARRVQRHYAEALAWLAADPPDLLVVVKGEVVPVAFLRDVRRANPACVLAFYSFDAFANSPRGASLLPVFDHAFSFDRGDVATHGLTYKPLFFTPEFAAAHALEKRHDLTFVGTVHSGRWEICRRLFAAGDDNVGFFYSPVRWHHVLQRVVKADVRRIPWSEVSFTFLPRAEVATLFGASRAVVDVHRTGQTGLTMRTFEVLAAGARLVTTNADVVHEPFYDPRWVHVLPGDLDDLDLEGLRSFVSGGLSAPAAALSAYSVDAWVREFLALVPTHAPVV